MGKAWKTEAQCYIILGEEVRARAEARSHCKGNSLKANLGKEVCVFILPGSESGCVVEVSTCVSDVWSVTPTDKVGPSDDPTLKSG